MKQLIYVKCSFREVVKRLHLPLWDSEIFLLSGIFQCFMGELSWPFSFGRCCKNKSWLKRQGVASLGDKNKSK